tara:strand:+ start:143 stop:1999 length:1857 start_codon:yes stop_codon:yes gene_type:complete
MSFTVQIGQLTGSTASNDAPTIAQGLENAQLEVMQKVAQVQPDMLHLLSSEVSSTGNDTGDDDDNELTNNGIVLNVSRTNTNTGYMSFDGSNDKLVTVGNSTSSLDKQWVTSTNGMSVVFLINFPAIGGDEPIYKVNDTTVNIPNQYGWQIRKGKDDRLYIDWGDGAGTSVDSNKRRAIADNYKLKANVWYHVIITTTFGKTSGTSIYINGQSTQIKYEGTADITTPVYVGTYASSHFALDDDNPGATTADVYGQFKIKYFGVYKMRLDSISSGDLIDEVYNNGIYFNLLKDKGDYTQGTDGSLIALFDFATGSYTDQTLNHPLSGMTLSGATLTKSKYNASYIDRKYINQVEDYTSIYYADATSPVYTVLGMHVMVYPIPSTAEPAVLTLVEPGTINDNSETIDNMPRFLHTQVVKLASYYVLLKRIGDVRDSLPTDLNDTTVFDAIADFNDSIGVTTALPSVPGAYSNAIDKAQALIDDVASIGGDTNTDGSGVDIYSAQKWLVDEDPEMLQSTLAVAAQELQRASTALSSHSAEINKYQAEISKESAEAGQALQEYQANLTKKIQSFTTLIGKLTTDYQWMTTQLGIIKNMIDEGWTSIFTPKGDNDISRVGARS